MSHPHILRAIQTLLANDKLKLIWTLPGQPSFRYEYLLSARELNACVTRCREALDVLQRTSDEPDDGALKQALRKLASAGVELYEVLMPETGESPGRSRDFRRWFEANVTVAPAGTWRVEFLYSGDQPVVPWGLTFSPAAIGQPRGTSFEDYGDFWAHRYLTVSYPSSAAALLNPDEGPLDGAICQFSLLIEAAPATVEVGFTSRGKDLDMRLRGLLSDQMLSTVNALRSMFREKRLWNHVVYLSLRSDSGAYPLKDEKLTPDLLRQIAAYLEDGGGHAIALIDREAIIRGDRGQEWRNTFFSDQWAGLIAVETDIVSPALHYHGFRFLTELLRRGVSLGESLLEIRRVLWPYSLLYGVYSNPDRVFVAPPPSIVEDMKQILEERQEGRRT